MITKDEIKRLMYLHRINQTQLAKALQIDKSTISGHLSGKLKLSRAYKAAYFYYFNPKMPENIHQYIIFFKKIEKEPFLFDVDIDLRKLITDFSCVISNEFNPIADIY